MAFWKWSRTASSNASSDNTVNWAEGMAPSAVNDSARAMMARLAEWRDDISGTIVTAGSATAYTITSNQGFDNFADMNGAMLAFVPHATSGATVTLNVDGLGAKPLRYGPSLELQSGVLIQGTPYAATYNNSDGAFYLQGGFANPYGIPLGGLLPYIGASAPNSAFALPSGQAISRTNYASLFSLVGTTFGPGDGATTFNIPDLRGRAIFGLDNMNGSAANRITVTGGNFDGTVLGGTGGAQNHTLAKSEIPTGLFTFNDVAHHHPPVNATDYLGQSGIVSANLATGGSFSVAEFLNTGDAFTGCSITDHAGGGSFAMLSPAMTLPYILRVI